MIYWFEELGREHNDMVGKKCANLGQMTRMGLAVPPGFALSIALYEKFIHETGTDEKMASYVKGLGNLQGVGISVFEEMSRTLRDLIEAGEMSSSMKEAIASYYGKLCKKTGIENAPFQCGLRERRAGPGCLRPTSTCGALTK